MRIAMVVHAYYLIDARVRRYAELLASEGHTVDVLCLGEGDTPKTDSHLGVGIHRIRQARLRGGRLSYVYDWGRFRKDSSAFSCRDEDQSPFL